MEYHIDNIKIQEIMPGYHGKLVHGESMSWVLWNVEPYAEVPIHQHIHEQIMHVISGEFEFTLDKVTKIYKAGSVIVIPSNTPHGGRALTQCQLIDVFSPVREAYK